MLRLLAWIKEVSAEEMVGGDLGDMYHLSGSPR